MKRIFDQRPLVSLFFMGLFCSSALTYQGELLVFEAPPSADPFVHFGFGNHAETPGDVNGDGVPDILFSSPYFDMLWNGEMSQGATHLYSGADGSALMDVPGGGPMSSAGDLNADGFADYLVTGHPAGTLVAVSGQDASVLRILSSEVIGNYWNPKAASLPDLDSDGLPELAVTDSQHMNTGRVVVFSSQGGMLFEIVVPQTWTNLGRSLTTMGDLNGDGVPELLIGAYSDSSGPQPTHGVYVFSGADGAQLFHVQRPSVPVDGIATTAHGFGLVLANLGDLNGDGLHDFAVTASARREVGHGTAHGGFVQIYSGADASVIRTLEGQDYDWGLGFFGGSLAGVGDLDGDGFNDLLVGEPHAQEDGRGAVHAVSGADGHTIYVLQGPSFAKNFGIDVDALADINGDGHPDFVVCSTDDTGSSSEPAAWAYSGFDSVGLESCMPTTTNSAGWNGLIRAMGSTDAADNDLSLRAEGLARNQFGYFLVGSALGQTSVPASQGALCLAGNLGRYNRQGQIQHSGHYGLFELELDLQALPTSPDVPVLAGQTWHFQAWYRDQNPGNTSNFTSAVSIAFN